MARTTKVEQTEKERLRLELDRDSFEEWVRRHDAGAELGVACDAVDSPEVRWAREISGLYVLADGRLLKAWDKRGGAFMFVLAYPLWMKRLGRTMDDELEGPVTREDVLEVLKKI